jgi:cytochrome c oxidase subunit 4
MAQHIVPRLLYYRIFATLLVLTAITVGVAFVDLGPFNTFLALAIALSKAVLVVLFFMHVRYSSRLVVVYVVAGLFWLVLLLGLSLADFLTRGWIRVSG